MTDHDHELTLNHADDDTTYCEVHPDRETGLRCNKCGRLMCAECAVQTPVGYRCRQCVRQHEDKFFRGTQNDYVIAAAVCLVLSAIAGGIMSAISFIFLALVLGFPIGGAISEAALRATERRRGRYSGQIMVAASVAGMLMGVAVRAFFGYNDRYGEIVSAYEAVGRRVPSEIPSLMDFIISDVTSIGILLFMGMVAFAIYSRFRM
ncbi:MAG: hypothetical protein RLP44_13105 [Aggregatilineales bacterium]